MLILVHKTFIYQKLYLKLLGILLEYIYFTIANANHVCEGLKDSFEFNSTIDEYAHNNPRCAW